jgi:hypothetical protein
MLLEMGTATLVFIVLLDRPVRKGMELATQASIVRPGPFHLISNYVKEDLFVRMVCKLLLHQASSAINQA